MKERLFMISIFIVLFIGTVIIFGSAINNDSMQGHQTNEINQEVEILQEGAIFNHSKNGKNLQNMPEGNRTMSDYYDNRAYPGAPPMIKHPLLSEKGIGGKTCLQCHQNGGFVNQFNAFAPVTPHPQWINCKQCHLPIKLDDLFVNTTWQKPVPPALGIKALETSPLVMPHGLQNRENCLSCHAGPAAPKEIRVSHPERINCRQCHVPHKEDNLFFTSIESRSSKNIQNSKETSLDEVKIGTIKKWIRKNEKNKN